LNMHLSENEGIEGARFAVTGGLGFVGAALCLELLRRGAQEVRSLDLRASSPWSQQLLDAGAHPNFRDLDGRTAMHIPACEEHAVAVQLLFERAARGVGRSRSSSAGAVSACALPLLYMCSC
jgi:nucleoside-diphosphate-sugar epimerase